MRYFGEDGGVGGGRFFEAAEDFDGDFVFVVFSLEGLVLDGRREGGGEAYRSQRGDSGRARMPKNRIIAKTAWKAIGKGHWKEPYWVMKKNP